VERPVPQSTIPGEYTSPTQPFPSKPVPFARQGISEDDLIDFTPELHARAMAFADSFQLGSLFTPPVATGGPEGKRGLFYFPGVWGSGNWNNGAFDPETGYYYALSHSLPFVIRMLHGGDPETELEYWGDANFSRGAEEVTIDGIPMIKPPWGRITAIDMNTGDQVWTAANGDPLNDQLKDHPLLEGVTNLPPLGIASRPVPLLTRTLLFLGEGSDVFGGTPSTMWGTTFRAYDKATGDVIWQTELRAGTTGAPMTYMHQGKQYVVVPTGSREQGAAWVALSLP
jgi:quinoprotein glucose dehydrogenase